MFDLLLVPVFFFLVPELWYLCHLFLQLCVFDGFAIKCTYALYWDEILITCKKYKNSIEMDVKFDICMYIENLLITLYISVCVDVSYIKNGISCWYTYKKRIKTSSISRKVYDSSSRPFLHSTLYRICLYAWRRLPVLFFVCLPIHTNWWIYVFVEKSSTNSNCYGMNS